MLYILPAHCSPRAVSAVPSSIPRTVPFFVQLSEYEEGEVPPPGTKRIRSLEDQVERLSVENMRMNEKARDFKAQVGSAYV